MKTVILVMGLPGSGKSTLCKKLLAVISDCDWINADTVRQQFNDWDFSLEGRIRQASRMKQLASESAHDTVILDFVCPLPETRDVVDADIIVWTNTINAGRFEDTNAVFVPPTNYTIQITSFEYDINKLADKINLLIAKTSF
jgi:adenylylsulfate kinase